MHPRRFRIWLHSVRFRIWQWWTQSADVRKARKELFAVLQDEQEDKVVQAVRNILTETPAAAAVVGDSGMLPLHEAVYYRKGDTCIELVTVLENAAPNSVATADVRGCLPLHIAAERHKDTDVLEMLLKLHPAAAMHGDNMGMLPLHFAVQHQIGNTKFLQVLILAAPQAAATSNANGVLPLHFAACCQTGVEGTNVVRLLLKSAPATAMHPTRDTRRLPLHMAAMYQRGSNGVPIITEIHNAAHDAIMTGDIYGWLPLHIAAQHDGLINSSSDSDGAPIVATLLKLQPAAARVTDNRGNLPLHIAAMHQGGVKGSSVIILLINASSHGTVRLNNFRKAPLDLMADRVNLGKLFIGDAALAFMESAQIGGKKYNPFKWSTTVLAKKVGGAYGCFFILVLLLLLLSDIRGLWSRVILMILILLTGVVIDVQWLGGVMTLLILAIFFATR